MRPAERVAVARMSYARAIALARAHCVPASWTRVLAAARNLRSAIRECEAMLERRASSSGGALVRPRPAAPAERGRAPLLRHPAAPPAPQAAPVARGNAPPLVSSAPGAVRHLRVQLQIEWARSRALIACSRRLMNEARKIGWALSGQASGNGPGADPSPA